MIATNKISTTSVMPKLINNIYKDVNKPIKIRVYVNKCSNKIVSKNYSSIILKKIYMRQHTLVLLFISIGFISLSFDKIDGWIKCGSVPESYAMGLDITTAKVGKNSATIKSIEASIEGFGSLAQKLDAKTFLGKRVKMWAYVKSKNVANWAGLWFRVDGKDSSNSLVFDNMYNRGIKGTTGWAKYEIVLDVPTNASRFVFGALLHGTGQIWFDDITFEVVNNKTNLTNVQRQEQ